MILTTVYASVRTLARSDELKIRAKAVVVAIGIVFTATLAVERSLGNEFGGAYWLAADLGGTAVVHLIHESRKRKEGGK